LPYPANACQEVSLLKAVCSPFDPGARQPIETDGEKRRLRSLIAMITTNQLLLGIER
jgi:hypothetical protein